MDATTAGNGGEVMGKEAYYFSHDSNARQDPKVSAMLSVYGAEGYGYYWMIVEMLREEATHTLDISGKYSFNAFALQLHCTPEKAKEFITDCIQEFALFESDGAHFWSNSLLRRMAMREELSQKRKKAAEKRWGKKPAAEPSAEKENANGMQLHDENDANAMQGKESKGKEKKEKEIKDKEIKTADKKPAVDLEFEFNEFYKIYKKKVDKKRAFEKFKSARKKHSFETIYKGTENYMAYCEANRTDVQYIKGAAVFLNGENFNDDYSGLIKKGADNYGNAGNTNGQNAAAHSRTIGENGKPVEYSFPN